MGTKEVQWWVRDSAGERKKAGAVQSPVRRGGATEATGGRDAQKDELEKRREHGTQNETEWDAKNKQRCVGNFEGGTGGLRSPARGRRADAGDPASSLIMQGVRSAIHTSSTGELAGVPGSKSVSSAGSKLAVRRPPQGAPRVRGC